MTFSGMQQGRRRFLRLLLNVGILLGARPMRSVGVASVQAGPLFARLLGDSILVGGTSTAMIVGARLATVESVLFRGRHIRAAIIERSDRHLVLRIHTTARWKPGRTAMLLATRDGGMHVVPASLAPSRSSSVRYGDYAAYAPVGYGDLPGDGSLYRSPRIGGELI